MKILFAMILLMIAVTYGCATGNTPVLEQTVSDVIEVGDITVEEVGTDTEVMPSDVQVSLDAADIVTTVDVEN